MPPKKRPSSAMRRPAAQPKTKPKPAAKIEKDEEESVLQASDDEQMDSQTLEF